MTTEIAVSELETYSRLCATCTACNFMPKQEFPRVLNWDSTNERPLILVLDDIYDARDSVEMSSDLLPAISFTLTSTIRCQAGLDLNEEQFVAAVAACSVWTKPLLEGRKLILSTHFGLKQMNIPYNYKIGEILKSQKYGWILVIPPLQTIKLLEVIDNYKPKVNRLLKECNLL